MQLLVTYQYYTKGIFPSSKNTTPHYTITTFRKFISKSHDIQSGAVFFKRRKKSLYLLLMCQKKTFFEIGRFSFTKQGKEQNIYLPQALTWLIQFLKICVL